jgi:hypothetical protein
VATRRPKLKSNFTLGGQQAETDPLAELAFFESSDYGVMASKTDPRCLVIGRTGAGKSAALQHLEEASSDHVIRVNPEDLSLPYVTDLQVIRYLDSLKVNLDLFWNALWKHVLLVEIIRHRYKVDSPAAKQNFLDGLRERIKRDPGKRAALEYLDEFQGRFWCETDVRVREIVDRFAERLGNEAKAGVSGPAINASGSVSSTFEEAMSVRSEEADRYQRVVNDTQLARLNMMLRVLNEEVLSSPQHFTYLIIDDLDRAWVDESLTNDLIRCLFRAVLDLKRVKHLKILVALRTNIFQELDFGRHGGGQEEKLRDLVLQVSWTRPSLEEVLDKRVAAAAATAELEARSISELLPNQNRTGGNPLDYILERTLYRPRDAIAYVNACLAEGEGKSRLTWEDIQGAERAYSSTRLVALRDEWKETYPGIDRVHDKFRNTPARFDRATFEKILIEIMLLPAEVGFPGLRWVTEASAGAWAATPDSSWAEQYGPLTRLLFNIGLIGCSSARRRAPIFFNDDPLFLEQDSNVESIETIYLHRAYQMALGAT